MKLWLISQDVNHGYDTYDSAVVAADTEEAARLTHPSEYVSGDWSKSDGYHGTATWAHPKDVKLKLLGEANPDTEAGVVCSSFNAG